VPVDREAVLAALEVIEQLDDAHPRRAMEDAIYRRMVGTRHNLRSTEVELWDHDGALAHQEVLTTEDHLGDLVGTADVRAEDAAELLAVMRSRRSVRSFADRALPEEHLRLVLEAGRWAPSAGNAQPWELLVVREAAGKQAIADALVPAVELLTGLDDTFPGYANPRYLLGAGALVLVLGDLRATAAYPYPLPRRARSAMLEQSLAMCIQNMWLMATRLGMVATNHTMGEPTSEDRIRRHFDIPEHHVLPTMLALGYPRRPQHPRPRRALDELVHHERYDRDRLRTDEELIDAFYAQGVRGRGFR
jgi:nitroreductase